MCIAIPGGVLLFYLLVVLWKCAGWWGIALAVGMMMMLRSKRLWMSIWFGLAPKKWME